ncbi:hypothetical protein GX48_03508 [Paracoccidioides brasiliensis]|nr:hypothetical protein GX48_03508 [Paracoccidioides brasiliensis]
MENICTKSPTPRHYATYTSRAPCNETRVMGGVRDGYDKNNKKNRKRSFFSLLGKKISNSKPASPSQSPISSPPPHSSSSTPPHQGSTACPRLSNQLTPATSTSRVSFDRKPAEYFQRLKQLTHSRRGPSSPLSSSHPPSPKHAAGCNDKQDHRTAINIIDDASNSIGHPQRQNPLPPTQPMTVPIPLNHPGHNDRIDINSSNNNNNNNDGKPPQDQPRTSSPLLPSPLQQSLLLNPSPSKESKFRKAFFRGSPPKSNTPLTQYNMAALQAELNGKPGAGCGVRDVSKPNPSGADGGDDYDELLELGRSARGAMLEKELNLSRERLICGVKRWLSEVQEGGEGKNW